MYSFYFLFFSLLVNILYLYQMQTTWPVNHIMNVPIKFDLHYNFRTLNFRTINCRTEFSGISDNFGQKFRIFWYFVKKFGQTCFLIVITIFIKTTNIYIRLSTVENMSLSKLSCTTSFTWMFPKINENTKLRFAKKCIRAKSLLSIASKEILVVISKIHAFL